MMTPKQEEHLEGLVEFLTTRVNEKYRRGAQEHNGDLLDLPPEQLCYEAIDEALDQITYLYTLLVKLERSKVK